MKTLIDDPRANTKRIIIGIVTRTDGTFEGLVFDIEDIEIRISFTRSEIEKDMSGETIEIGRSNQWIDVDTIDRNGAIANCGGNSMSQSVNSIIGNGSRTIEFKTGGIAIIVAKFEIFWTLSNGQRDGNETR